jgi:hypothetical protein
MAGYSGTPLATKLGIKPGHTVGLINAPEGFERVLDGLPPGTRVMRVRREKGPFNVLVCFVVDRLGTERQVRDLAGMIEVSGGLWFGWPKRSSKRPTDITEDVLREIVLPLGLVDNKVCAIDDTWSGLRFVWRLEKRAAIAAGKPA